jgi:hypothetical protein
MIKRISSALLWFVAVAWGFNFLSAYAGVPELVGSLAATSVALFVAVDPLHLLWPSSAGKVHVRPASARRKAGVPSRI